MVKILIPIDLLFGRGLRVDDVHQGGSTAALRLARAAFEEIEKPAANDCEHPMPKPSSLRVVFEFANGIGDRAHHFLRDIGSIGLLQSIAAAVAKDQWRVNLDEFFPGALIL